MKRRHACGKTGTHKAGGFAEKMREGASSVILYFGFCVLAAIGCATFVAFAQTYTGTEQAQLISDSASDSAAFAAYEVTKGWSMPWEVVNSTTKNVARLNASGYGLTKNSKVAKQGTYTAKADRTIAEAAKQVFVETQVNRNDTATFLGNWSAKRNARTEYAFAGGMEIVMRAYMFTKQCVEEGSNPMGLKHRTLYAWGGGRGGWDESGSTETMPCYADCSGFVHYIYEMCGYSIGGTTYDMDGQGREIDPSKEDPMPGDIVLFYTGGVATHVGIYVGENSSGTRIMIDCTAGYSGHSRETHIGSENYPSSGSKGVTVRPIYGNSYKFRRLVTDYGESYDFGRNKNNDAASRVFYTLMSLNEDGETIITPTGACALMGNWYQEGGLGKPGIDEPGAMCETRSGDKSYNNKMKKKYDSADCTATDFADDYYDKYDTGTHKGYGMGQWTPMGRKINLFNFTTKVMHGHVYDEELQAIFAVKEIYGEYPGDYTETRKAITRKNISVKEAADIVYIEFEMGRKPTPKDYDKAKETDGTIKIRESAAQYFYNRFVKGEIQMLKNGQDVTKKNIPKMSKGMTDPGVIQLMTYPAHFLRSMTVKMKGGTTRNVKKGDKVLVTKHTKKKDTLQFPDGSIGYATRNDLYYDDQNYDSSFEYEPNVITDFVNKKGYSSKTEFMFFCSKYNQHVYVFKGKKGSWELYRVMKCSTGSVHNDGGNSRDQARSKEYEIYNKGNTTSLYKENKSDPNWMGPRCLQYWNMHYSGKSGNSIHRGSVGHPSTHGCIALKEKDAKWCYYNLPVKTRVVVH